MTRLISGLLLAILGFFVVLYGSIPFYAILIFVAIYGCYEITLVLDKNFKSLLYISMLGFIAAIYFVYQRSTGIILFFVAVLFFLAVVNENISLSDISVSFLLSVVLAFAIHGASTLRNINPWIIIYLAFASLVSDIGAYYTGRAIGKHKLNERVSPNKTIEGAIGGWLAGFIASLLLAYYFKFFGYPIWFMVLSSLILPAISELGDLSFSLIKRNYNVKDFSNLIPGHGGLLDRIDSLLLCLILFSSMVSFL